MCMYMHAHTHACTQSKYNKKETINGEGIAGVQGRIANMSLRDKGKEVM